MYISKLESKNLAILNSQHSTLIFFNEYPISTKICSILASNILKYQNLLLLSVEDWSNKFLIVMESGGFQAYKFLKNSQPTNQNKLVGNLSIWRSQLKVI